MSPLDILLGLPPDVRRDLAPLLLPYAVRAVDAADRDAALTAALAGTRGASTSARAASLATRLQTYVTGAAWRVEKRLAELPATATDAERALHRLARANGGEGLSARRIRELAAKCRGIRQP